MTDIVYRSDVALLPLHKTIAALRGLALGLLVLSSAAGCAGDDEDEPITDYELEGRVVDDLDGDPISGAKVIFISDTLDETTARTGGDGRYHMIASVRAGVTLGTLHAEHPDYEDGPKQTVYFDGTARTVNLTLRATGD